MCCAAVTRELIVSEDIFVGVGVVVRPGQYFGSGHLLAHATDRPVLLACVQRGPLRIFFDSESGWGPLSS